MSDKATISIRRGNVYDLFALEFLLSKGLEESNGLLPDYDQLPTLHKSLDMLHTGSVFVACEGDEAARSEKIVGCLALNPEAFSWNSAVVVLRSVHFYVLPAFRARTLADGVTLVFDGLRRVGSDLADAANMPMIIEQLHQVGPDNRAEAKDELFKRAGLSYVGGNFVYLPKPRQEQGKAA